MPKHHNWRAFYLAFIKQCGKECWQTWRGEMLASVVTIACVYLIDRNGIDVKTALLATAYTLCLFVLWHTSRVPWILYQQLDAADHLKPLWAFVGAIFVGGSCVLLLYTAAWFYTMQPTMSLTKIPDGRDKRITELEAQIKALAPLPEPEDSLRHRTKNIANQVQHFLEERFANHPPFATPDSRNPNPSEEQQKKIAISLKYDQDTLVYYRDHFSQAMIQIVREYDNRQVETGFLATDLLQLPWLVDSSSPARKACQDTLCKFQELEYHVDAKGVRVEVP